MRINNDVLCRDYKITGNMTMSLKCPEELGNEDNPEGRIVSEVIEDYLGLNAAPHSGSLFADDEIMMGSASVGITDWHSQGEGYVELQLSFSFEYLKAVPLYFNFEFGENGQVINTPQEEGIRPTSEAIYTNMVEHCNSFALQVEKEILENSPIVAVNSCDITYDSITD